MKKKLLPVFLSFIIVLIFGVVVLGNTVFGLDEATSRRYANNNIIFYNPNGSGSSGICPEKYPLKAGGLSKTEAEAFMSVYRNSEGCAAELNITTMCPGGLFANCTAVSKYFVNRYTTKRVQRIGNGKDVVKNLAALGFPTGNTPQPYAIFSTKKGNKICEDGEPCGHTGVVLGISGNTVYTGEAACGPSLSAAKVHTYQMSDLTNGQYTFAYAANFIDYSGE